MSKWDYPKTKKNSDGAKLTAAELRAQRKAHRKAIKATAHTELKTKKNKDQIK